MKSFNYVVTKKFMKSFNYVVTKRNNDKLYA